MSNIESNIWKLYVIKALRWFMLIMPIIVLFFQENGLSMKEVLLLQSIFSIGIILFEIPSGYFSDVIGRKTTIVIGCILGFLGFSIYSFSYGFWGFLIAELTLGLGSSFLSGTDSAIIYDSLIQSKKEKDYKKIEGRMLSVGNFSEAIASFLGGFVALISLRTPFYIETILMLFTIPLAFTLIEPKRQKYENEEGPIKEIIKIVKYSIHHNGEIKWLIFYSGFIGASTLTMVWFIQPYFQFVGLPLAYFGIAWGILNLSVGIFSLYAHKIEFFFGRKKSLISLIFISFIGYMLLGIFSSLWAISFIILFYFVRGISGPILKDYVNKIISSNMRATVLSVKNLFGRLVFAIIGPFIGWITDIYSLQLALLTSGSIFVILGIISLLFLHKNKAL
ncbi:MFS transporter [Candidatus Woesearchaeota archaeon]|nr:MFS transporter [Candidatus Woesearchaeota archaeon]